MRRIRLVTYKHRTASVVCSEARRPARGCGGLAAASVERMICRAPASARIGGTSPVLIQSQSECYWLSSRFFSLYSAPRLALPLLCKYFTCAALSFISPGTKGRDRGMDAKNEIVSHHWDDTCRRFRFLFLIGVYPSSSANHRDHRKSRKPPEMCQCFATFFAMTGISVNSSCVSYMTK